MRDHSALFSSELFVRLLLCCALLCVTTTARAQSADVNTAFAQATQAMREGKLEEAGAGFADIVKQTPAFAEAHFNLGLVRQEQGRYEEAIPSFQKALTLQPRLRGANLFLGITEFRLNRLDKAAAAVQKETTAYPKDANAWMWLGVVRLAQDRAEDAADALDRAARLKPDDPDILYHRGRAHLLVSKDSYAEMFKVDPHSWHVHRVLAQANAEADRHVEAIAEYEAAIKLAPTQPGLHEELGSELRNANKIPEAQAAFKRELEIDPQNVLARYKLGAIAVEQGDGATGKELMEAAQREKPGLVHIDYNLGRAEMLLGNDAAAAEHFERTVKSDTTSEVVEQAWYQLGTIYRRQRRMDEARNAMATFQKLKDEEADKSQERMKRSVLKSDTDTISAPTDTPDPQ
jgi:tetratricopeptide (TPR) repeat protein